MNRCTKAQLSRRSKYYISKHRRYELNHFCLQYGEWKKEYQEILFLVSKYKDVPARSNSFYSDTERVAILCAKLAKKIELVERCCELTDPELSKYILEGVTDGRGYDYMYAKRNIPCCKDTYYDRIRRFYWILSEEQ